MKSAAILKQKLSGDKPVLGALATFHFWPGLIELAMRAGLDYVIIDLEHLTHNQEAVAEACAIGRRADFAVLIRPPSAEFTFVRLALDLGPCGMLVPYIQKVEELDEVRDAVYMKPRGRRRPGGLGNFWVSDVNYPTWKKEVEDDLIILPQIESKLGLQNVEAIARHPLTTAIAVGPYDLSCDLGVCWQPDSPLLVNALAQIREAGKKAGKNMWMLGDGPSLMKRGFNFICLTEFTMLIEGTIGGMVKRTREGTPSASQPDRPLP